VVSERAKHGKHSPKQWIKSNHKRFSSLYTFFLIYTTVFLSKKPKLYLTPQALNRRISQFQLLTIICLLFLQSQLLFAASRNQNKDLKKRIFTSFTFKNSNVLSFYLCKVFHIFVLEYIFLDKKSVV